MSRTVVYVGAQDADYILTHVTDKFDRALIVHPLIEQVEKLRSATSACTLTVLYGTVAPNRDVAMARIYIASNGVSSSQGTFKTEWIEGRDLRITASIDVVAVDLLKQCEPFLPIHSVVCEAQGADIAVVEALKPVLAKKLVVNLRCKTTRDGYKNVYNGLPSNELQSFRAVLEPLGYQLAAVGWGNIQPGTFHVVPPDWWEFHSLFTPAPSDEHAHDQPSLQSTSVDEAKEATVKSAAVGGEGVTVVTSAFGGAPELAVFRVPRPMVVFCDEESYLPAWRERRRLRILDRSMFVCTQPQHLPFTSLAPAPQGASETATTNKLMELCAPHFMLSAITMNPFHTPIFAWIRSATTADPVALDGMLNPKQALNKQDASGDACQPHESWAVEGEMVAGPLGEMEALHKTLHDLYSAAMQSQQSPDTSFHLSQKALQLIHSGRDHQGQEKTASLKCRCQLAGLARSVKALREAGDTRKAHQLAVGALHVAKAKSGGTGGDKSEDAYAEFWREALVTGWLAGDRSLAMEAFDRCTASSSDKDLNEFAGKCAQLIAVRLSSVSNSSLVAEVPVKKRAHLVNGNLTIFPLSQTGRYVAVSRMINWINGRCVHPQNILTNENAVLILGADMRVVREDELVDVTNRLKKPTGWTGFEDVRIYDADESCMRFMCTIFEHEGGSKPQIARCLAVYVGNNRWEVVHVQPLQRLAPDGEKNWLAFKPPVERLLANNDDLATIYAVYHWYPRYQMLKIMPDGSHTTLVRDEQPRPGAYHQGSCAPIWCEPLGAWLALIHLSWDIFYHRFVLLDKDTFRIKQMSAIFYLHRQGVEYCCGMCLDHTQTNLVLSYGRGDSSSHVLRISLSSILHLFPSQ